jgi:hypothetical protein
MPKASDSYATEGDLSGHTSTTTRPSDSGEGRDVIEAQPGVIESTELAPLNDEIVAPDSELGSSPVGSGPVWRIPRSDERAVLTRYSNPPQQGDRYGQAGPPFRRRRHLNEPTSALCVRRSIPILEL